MDYASTDGFVNSVPIEHPNRQVHPQKKKKKSDLDDGQTSRKTQTVKIGSKSSSVIQSLGSTPSTVSCRVVPQLLDAYWQKNQCQTPCLPILWMQRAHSVAAENPVTL